MAVIKAQKIPKRIEPANDILARFCYYFPQYKYHEARKLPHIRIVKMLRVARSEQAKLYINLVNIASAPHTDKGKGINKMIESYQNIIDGKE
jgi:hypothetical protein